MNRLLAVGVVLAALGTSGCRHSMQIKNLHEYAATPLAPLEPPRNLGVTSRNVSDPETRGYAEAIVEGLRRDGSFARVIYPYDAAAHQAVTDLVVDLSIAPRYSGKGSNFLVNWPGFLIFAPAIWGYGYVAEIDTRVAIAARNAPPQELAIPTRYTFRQAEIDRTWTELGWLELGIIPLIGGIAFTEYDPDVTPEFVMKVGPSYGAFVAQRIHQQIASMPAPPPRSAAPAAPIAPEPAPAAASL